MDRMLLVLIFILGGATLILGSASLLKADSPYDMSAHVERDPAAEPLPANRDRASVRQYVIRFEETRLENDLLGSRGFMLDIHDKLVTRCSAVNVRAAGTKTFRVALRCHGDIVDVYRPLQPTGFDYTVVYRITPNSIEQVALDGFPFEGRDNLKPETPTSAVA